MSTVEKPAKLTPSRPIDLDEIAGMSLEERSELSLPDHTQLPDRDGTFVQNFQEHPQTILLTNSIEPVLKRLHPDGRYLVGQDCGIYWRVTDPPLRGVKCPDWFYVPGAPRTPSGTYRRSYVLWNEWIPPLILLEIVSGDGSEERDRTPNEGKFWVYENVIRPAYYGIYDSDPGRIEMYHHVEGRFESLPVNERGRYAIDGLGVELGLWQGEYLGDTFAWMRWWDADGELLLTGFEMAEQEAERADLERERAAREAERADLERERAAREAERADVEEQRAAREAERADVEEQRAAREAERADVEEQRAAREAERADVEEQRAAREAERADVEEQRAAREAERADLEEQRADRETTRADRLAAQLRALGLEPEA